MSAGIHNMSAQGARSQIAHGDFRDAPRSTGNLVDETGLDSFVPDDLARQMLRALQLVQQRAPTLTLNQLKLFLTIARYEGLRIKDLARMIGDLEANVSRNVRSMTDSDYPGSLNAAHGLLTLLRGARDSRSRHVVLSNDGRVLYSEVLKALAGSPPRSHPGG